MRRQFQGPSVSSRTKLALGLFTLVACGDGGASMVTPGESRDASAPDSVPIIVGQPDASTRDASVSIPKDVDPPSFACGARPPRALTALCTGCHVPGSPFPDLLAYQGSQAEFLQRVRMGGGGMPAFSASTLDDASVAELYAYLKAGHSTPISLGNVEPLFSADASVLPISFTRADGVLVTRGAGRVRGRHELEESYGPFHPDYFEDRTFGFVIEDYTVRGENKIVVSYLPAARPTDGTNFRAFKIYGDGNVFHANTGMDSDVPVPSMSAVGDYKSDVASYARVQSRVINNNARTGKPLKQGDLFEFEFGVFIDKAAVRANTRTNYYSDTFRYRVGSGALTPESADSSGKLGPFANAQLGGATTVAWAYAEPELYMSQMALDIQHEHVQSFVEGRRLFHTDFDTGAHSESGNPVFSEQAHKRGPLFVTESCVNCHPNNGGGRTLAGALDDKSSMTFKLYGGSLGNQLQLGEGSARASSSESKTVKLADTSVTLQRPHFDVKDAKAVVLPSSARIARRLVGLGLLEAVDESTLLAQADPEDCDGDGISGRAQLVPDPEGGAARVGRFGWRAEKVSLRHQVADALEADLGVTSPVIPGAGAKLNDADLARMVAYVRLLGVPPQRDAEQVKPGELLFHEVGCTNCHLPALTTGNTHPFVELRGQSIRPYSDLLLHDMGPELADDSGTESASEWRTAPLWGVGLSQQVQGYVALLHDGRAASVLEAVLWHGGEAQTVRDRVLSLSADERNALIRFVESL